MPRRKRAAPKARRRLPVWPSIAQPPSVAAAGQKPEGLQKQFLPNFGTTEKVILAMAVLTAVIFTYLGWWGRIFENPDTVLLPYYTLRTLLRMLAAFALVVLFSVPYGIIAGMYRRPRKVMLPLLDILQSIPVLGYLPAAIFLFTSALPSLMGFELGYEAAAVFLIFTGMAWAVAFSVLSSVRNIPNDIREASNAFGMRGWRYVRRVVLPCIVPSFITGSILAWGGGWYFLVAAELITYGALPHALPGLGSYLGNAIAKHGNVPSALFGLVVFVSLIYVINRKVWRPLSAYAKKFRFQSMNTEIFAEANEPALIVRLIEGAGGLWDILDASLRKISRFWSALQRSLHLPSIHIPRRRHHVPQPWYQMGAIYGILFVLVMLVVAYFFSAAFLAPLLGLRESISAHPELSRLPEFALYSLARISIAYLIALAWTLAAAIAITRSRALSEIFFPLFDIGQSTPALALFPFIVLIVIRVFGGGGIAVEIAAILLLLTGTQWYLLFNIIGAIRQIPGDVLEASRAFGLRDFQFYRLVLLPAIFPGIIVGSIQAFGGAWNALIVSEYIPFGSQTYSVPGLGSFLTKSTLAPSPDPWVLTLIVATMALAVLLINAFLWKPLFALAERYKFDV